MPMNTTCVGRAVGSSRPKPYTWSTTSPTVRLRASPIRPVAQKVQAIAQPACVETQTESRFAPSGEVAGIATVSISWPSARRTSRLRVPSRETAWTTRSPDRSRYRSARAARSRAGRSVISSQEPTSRPCKRTEQLLRAVGGLAKLCDDGLEGRQIKVEDARQRRHGASGHGVVSQIQEGKRLDHTVEVCGRFRDSDHLS